MFYARSLETMIETGLTTPNDFGQFLVDYLIFRINDPILAEDLPILSAGEIVLEVPIENGVIPGQGRNVLYFKLGLDAIYFSSMHFSYILPA